VIVTDVEAMLSDVLEMDEQARALLAAGELFKADRLQAEMDVKLNELRVRLAQIQQMKTVTNATMLGRVVAVQQRVDELMGRRLPRETLVTRSLADKTLTEVRARFESGNFGEVATLCQAWFEFLKGKQFEPHAQELIEAMSVLRSRARVLAETEGFSIVISGTIVHDLDPARSGAVINGTLLRPGEAVDSAGEVRLKTVQRDGVELLYKGETFLRLRGTASRSPAVPKAGTKSPAKSAAKPTASAGASSGR
jgi:hypothetical protein